MKVLAAVLVVVCGAALIVLEPGAAGADPASALVESAQEAQGPKVQNYQGSYLWGLEVGGALPSQDIHGSLSSGWGEYVSGQALYGVWPHVLLGMDMDFYHVPVNIQSTGFNLGAEWTLAVMPMIEFRTNRMGNWSFYGNIGVGMNDDNFMESPGLTSACGIGACSITMQIAFAARFAVGADYYLSQNLSATVEGGYMMNYTPASVSVSVPGYTAPSAETFNLSTVFVLVGFHYDGTP